MDRLGFIGGTDAKRLIDGDWVPLWMEKTGRTKPEDLTHQWNVQLGIHTERFHIAWLNKYHGFDIVKFPQQSHATLPWMKANLDGWSYTHDTFLDAKHSNARATRDSMVDWYQPQIAHYCLTVNRDHGWLSYIAGNESPDYFKMAPSQAYRDSLLEIEKAFWWHVETDTKPDVIASKVAEDALDRIVTAAKDVTIDDMRVADMNGNNKWADAALDYTTNKAAAATFEQAKKDLKALVEDDVRIAAGHGIMIKRSKNGSLLISESLT